MNEIKNARIIRVQGGRAIELPPDLDLPAGFDAPDAEIVVVAQGDKLIVETHTPSQHRQFDTFHEMLDHMETLDIEWPDVDEGLLPPDDIKL